MMLRVCLEDTALDLIKKITSRMDLQTEESAVKWINYSGEEDDSCAWQKKWTYCLFGILTCEIISVTSYIFHDSIFDRFSNE